MALKVLHRDLVKDNGAVQRFYREIEVASHLSHPNIVQSHEAGPMGPALVLAMEYVQGTNLERRVEKAGPLPVEQACDYIRQAAEGLDYAQQRGLVHRDIKPANLLLDQTGVVKILDLGLARLTEYAAGSKTQDLTIHENKSVMQGTPDYMAPEQALDFHRVDTRADIYSLGCTLFYLLSGKPPFPADTLAKKLMKHQQLAAPVETLRIPSGLAAVLRKLLAKKPEDRYQTPGEVVKALTPFCRPGSTEARESSRPKLGLPAIPSRQRLLLAGGGGLALLILCFFLFRGGIHRPARRARIERLRRRRPWLRPRRSCPPRSLPMAKAIRAPRRRPAGSISGIRRDRSAIRPITCRWCGMSVKASMT